jgi:hypothetical protein
MSLRVANLLSDLRDSSNGRDSLPQYYPHSDTEYNTANKMMILISNNTRKNGMLLLI